MKYKKQYKSHYPTVKYKTTQCKPQYPTMNNKNTQYKSVFPTMKYICNKLVTETYFYFLSKL